MKLSSGQLRSLVTLLAPKLRKGGERDHYLDLAFHGDRIFDGISPDADTPEQYARALLSALDGDLYRRTEDGSDSLTVYLNVVAGELGGELASILAPFIESRGGDLASAEMQALIDRHQLVGIPPFTPNRHTAHALQPPPLLPGNYFIKRQRYVDYLLKLIHDINQGVVVADTNAIYGMGKTTVLSHLFYDQLERSGVHPIWLPLDHFSIYRTNPSIEDMTSDEALCQNLHDWYLFLLRLSANFENIAFADFNYALDQLTDKMLTKLLRPGLTQHSVVTIEDWPLRPADVNTHIYRNAIEGARKAFGDEFLWRLRRMAPSGRFVLFADDYCWIAEQSIGSWFFDLVLQMPQTLLILSRTDAPLPVDGSHFLQLTLAPFDLSEIRQYLSLRFPDVEHPIEIESLVAEFSQGVPLMVSLAADLIVHLGGMSSPALVERVRPMLGLAPVDPAAPYHGVDRMTPDRAHIQKRMVSVMDSLRKVLDRDPVMHRSHGLDICLIARRFDAAAIRSVVARMGDDVADESEANEIADKVMRTMMSLSFVHPCDAHQEDNRSAEQRTYRVHPFVQEQMDEVIEKRDATSWRKIHELLADHFAAVHYDEEVVPADKSEYARLYRMEEPAWQTAMVEWLYHLDHLDVSRANLGFTRLYLDAFDWWGAYQPFKFCDDLLDAWRGRHHSRRNDLGELLRGFQGAYPTGFYKQGCGQWQAVTEHLLALLELLNLPHLAPGLTPNMTAELFACDCLKGLDRTARHVVGHIYRFLGDAAAFGDPPDHLQATLCYTRAIGAFDEPPWYAEWVRAYLADSTLAAGLPDEAIRLAHVSIAWAAKELQVHDQDHELISLNFRIMGDSYLTKGMFARAMECYGDSLVYAFLFMYLKSAGYDSYGIMWYCDLGHHIVEMQLGGLWVDGKRDLARDGCLYLRRLWGKAGRRQVLLKGRAEDIGPLLSDKGFTSAPGGGFGPVAALVIPEPPDLGLANRHDRRLRCDHSRRMYPFATKLAGHANLGSGIPLLRYIGAGMTPQLRFVELESPDSDEARAAFEIYESAFPEHERDSVDQLKRSIEGRMRRGTLRVDRLRVFVAVDGDEVVGLSIYRYHTDRRLGFLWYVATKGTIRSQGLGSWLLERTLDDLRAVPPAADSERPFGMCLEVEHTDEADNSADRELRLRRIRFYERNGGVLMPQIDLLTPALHVGSPEVRYQVIFHPIVTHDQVPANLAQTIVDLILLDAYNVEPSSTYYQRAVKALTEAGAKEHVS